MTLNCELYFKYLNIDKYDYYVLRSDVLYKYKDGYELLVVPKFMQNNVTQATYDKGHFSVKCTKEHFKQKCDDLKIKAKEQILKTQKENRRIYNLRRKKPRKYQTNDLVAIKRVQMRPGKKLRAKYLGPYKIYQAKLNDTYDVKRIVPREGPSLTSTCTEYMKPWSLTNENFEAED